MLYYGNWPCEDTACVVCELTAEAREVLGKKIDETAEADNVFVGPE